MKAILSKLVDNYQHDWDKYFPLFVLAYRYAVDESTKATPSYVNFDRGQLMKIYSDRREVMREIHAVF